MRGDHLRAVVPIGFVAVVFFRVVRCSDDHTALASEMADCKRHFRSRAARVEEIHLDAVGREDVGNDFGEFAAVVAHVVTHHNLDFREVLERHFQIV